MTRPAIAAVTVTLALLLGAASAAPVSAELRLVGLDPAARVLAYGAAGVQHIAVTQAPGATRAQIVISSDGGRSFEPLADDPSITSVTDASVEPDGRRWIVAHVSGQPGFQLLTATPGSGWTGVRAFPSTEQPTAPELTPAGRLLALTRNLPGPPSTRQIEVHRVGEDGTDAQVTYVTQTPWVGARISPDVQGAWVRTGDGNWFIDVNGQLSARPAWTPDLSPLGSDVRMLNGRLYRVQSAEVWWPVIDPEFTSVSELVPVDGGMLVRGQSQQVAVIAVLSAPQTAVPRGDLAADTKQLVDASNVIRAEQGLPALIGDPLVSVASRNHAAYDRRWHEAHGETPGRAGFTGAGPSARCEAVAASCGGEIMHYRDIPASVSDWWATPLHRFITGGPAVVVVGAGAARDSGGTTAVMNIASGGTGVIVAPLGLPRGSWEGQLGFGGESPDPGAPCGIHEPYGTAVTAYGYIDPATGADWAPEPVSLVDVTDGNSLVRGCAQREYFLPDDALKAGHLYSASTVYLSAAEPPRPFSWTFKTKTTSPSPSATPKPAPDRACLAVSRRPARVSVQALRRGIRIRLRSCVRGNVRIELRRGRRSGGRVIARRTIRIANGRTRTVRFAARNVRPGRVMLRVVQGKRTAKVNLTVRR